MIRWIQLLPRTVRIQALGFGGMLVLLALNEYVDLPLLLFGELPTPLRHHEFVMESAAVCVIAAMVMAFSWFADRRLHRLDSLLVMCSWCRQVQVKDHWMSLECFLKERNAIASTYGLCPECYETETGRHA